MVVLFLSRTVCSVTVKLGSRMKSPALVFGPLAAGLGVQEGVEEEEERFHSEPYYRHVTQCESPYNKAGVLVGLG